MAFCRPSGVMITPSHFSVRGRRWEVGTTTNGGVLRLFARFEFAEDRCVGRLLAVKCGHRGITTMRGTDTGCNTSELAARPPLNSGLGGARGVAAAAADCAPY